MKKLALILLSAMLLSSFAACSDTADTQKPSDVSDTEALDDTKTTETDKYADDLPDDLDLGGLEFNVYTRSASEFFTYTLDTAEETGDVVNDAIYRRNRSVEERLNFTLKETYYYFKTDGNDKPRQLLMAADDTYDMFIAKGLQSFTYAAEGMLNEFTDLGYVDLDKPYWDQSINEAFVLGGKMYFAVGAFNLTSYEWTHTLLFNKKMLDSFKLDNPYEIVKNNEWTFDRFNGMAKTANADLNGDSVMDANDRYGFVSVPKQVLPCFWIAADTLCIQKDSEGRLIYSTPGDEKFAAVYEKVFNMMYNDGIWFQMSTSVTDLDEYGELFVNGQALFHNCDCFRLARLRAMETDFGILPYPMWDESQDGYISRIEGCEVPLIPLTNSDLDSTGAILEALASASPDTSVAAYYDIALTGKVTRDEDSVEMLDIIYSRRIYDYGDTIMTSELRDGVLRDAFAANNRDLASILAAVEPKVMARLNLLNGEE
nr:hypothetical protein [Clostridia bacterium]